MKRLLRAPDVADFANADAFFCLLRHFSASIPRPFTARYDAYTQSIELLDTKVQILKNMRQINRELKTLTGALHRL